MKSVFDIIGPVMIGPSSSHTAGAARLGKIARSVLGEQPVRAEITLFGSFAETYRGHGTDRALVGGLLGMNTDDDRIKDALDIAGLEGLTVQFKTADSADHKIHPNTAGIALTGLTGKQVYVEGSSIGGGNILITRINDFEVGIRGKFPAILAEHYDRPGVIGGVTGTLGENGINIASIKMVRQFRGANNLMVIETDQLVSDFVLQKIREQPHLIDVIKIEPVEVYDV